MANQFFFVTMALVFTSLLHVESRNGEFLFVSLDRSVKTHDKLTPLETPTPAPVAGGENNNIDEFAPVPAAPESGNIFAPSPIESGNGFFGFAPVQSPAPAPSRGDEIEIAPTPSVSGIGNAIPVPVPAPAPESFETDNPYGLYGQEEADKEELNNQRLPDAEYNNNYKRNTDDDDTAGGYSNTAYNSMSYSNRAYNSMGYSNEKQGMSDTRFLDNGKYYYNPSQESYNNQNDGGRYESVRESSNEEGYYGKLSQSDLNSMEEYERQNGYSP